MRLCPPYAWPRKSPARPDVEHVAIFCAEIVDPALGGFRISAGAFAVDSHQRGLDVGFHLCAVAADVDDRALLDQAPDAILLRRDQVLHIGLRALAARKRGMQFGDAARCMSLELIGVKIILIGMPAAEEQYRRTKRLAIRLQRGALLQ